jgi:hypothetical protein
MLLQQLAVMIVAGGHDMERHYDAFPAYVTKFYLANCSVRSRHHIQHNVYPHPVRNYLGRWWVAASRLPYSFFIPWGTATLRTRDLHDKYGHFVRISPDILSYTCKQVWSGNDIFAITRCTP